MIRPFPFSFRGLRPQDANIDRGHWNSVDERLRSAAPVACLFDRQAAGAFLLYLMLSVFVFGRAVIGHPATMSVGRGPDPQLYIWFMAWWAHAISHGLNPFLTGVIWRPTGVNLAWTANMPLAAWLLYPVTRGFGPIVSYNLLCLLSPALAGWGAFALCRYLAGGWRPAILGGLLFAFS